MARLQTGLINQIEESSRPAGAVGRDLCQQNTKIKFMFHQHDPGGGKVRRLGGELLGIGVKEIYDNITTQTLHAVRLVLQSLLLGL